MKRILFVESYPKAFFGQQRTLLSLLDNCPQFVYELIISAPSEGMFLDKIRDRGLHVEILPYPEMISGYGGVIYNIKGLSRLKMLFQTMLYIFSIRATLKRMSISGVFCNDMRGLLTVGIAARFLGLPVMIWDKLDKPHGWLDSIHLLIVSKNLIISNAVLNKYPSWQIKLFSNKIIKITEGIDLQKFDTANSIRSHLGLCENDIVLTITGAITERKGHDRIFSVWDDLVDRVPNIHLLIVGECPPNIKDKKYFNKLKQKNYSNIHFLGMRSDIPELMKSTDILLVPSRSEGMGMVILEAMAACIPVIGANTGGIPEVIIDGETGILFNGDNSQQLISKIIYLAESVDLRNSMGLSGRHRVEMLYNRKKQMQRVWEYLSAMLAK